MARPATQIILSQHETNQLVSMSRKPKIEARYALRAQIILKAAKGVSGIEIARQLGVSAGAVSKWRVRFESERCDGSLDDFRPGRPPKIDFEKLRERLLEKLDEPPPTGFAGWDGTLLGKALGVSADSVWSVLRRLGISLKRRRSWCVSTDPEFTQKSANIVGLYLAPPENAVVLSFDGKPCIQALERDQGWLKMPDGRALTGFAHEYKRHGTSTLFAALNVATGQVTGGHFKRRRRVDFLKFMDQLVAQYPGKELHVILDNLSTHKVEKEAWTKAHPEVHFHFTPTHASWLNQVEVWFSILTAKALRGSSFKSVKELTSQIDAFIAAYNEEAAPFEWTRVRVHAKTFAGKYANLFK
jgi:transposase